MWTATLALGVQRVILILALFITLNLNNDKREDGGSKLRMWNSIEPLLFRYTSGLDEYRELESVRRSGFRSVFHQTKNPMIWVARMVATWTNWSSAFILILVSNFFLLWFLSSLHQLFQHLSMPEEAADATILAALWMTGYESSMGSSDSVAGLAAVFCLQGALDNRWWLCGAGLAILFLLGTTGIAFIPYLLIVFLYFQRHFFSPQIMKNFLLLVVPSGLAAWWCWDDISRVQAAFNAGAFGFAWEQIFYGGQWQWLWQRDYMGQTLTLIGMGIAMVMFLGISRVFIHWLIPVTAMAAWVSFTPYAELSSWAYVVLPCLLGPAVVLSKSLNWSLRLLFMGLGVYEVVSLLSVQKTF